MQIFGAEYAELKRMYVRPEYRGRTIGKLMLDRLVLRAMEGGVRLLRLETGIQQSAAIRLYEMYGFRRRPAFPPYRDDPLSYITRKSL